MFVILLLFNSVTARVFIGLGSVGVLIPLKGVNITLPSTLGTCVYTIMDMQNSVHDNQAMIVARNDRQDYEVYGRATL